MTDKTYLMIGTVTKDLLDDGSFIPGGTISYAGTIAKKLGWSCTAITSAGPDFEPPAHLTDIDWHIVPAAETTTFRNEYTPEGRIQTINAVAETITPANLPVDCLDAAVVHLCPLAQDVAPEVADACDKGLLAATPQGWLRRWDSEGRVSLGNWKALEAVLPRLEVVVISIEDVEYNWSLAEKWATQVPMLIVTQGEKGCTIFQRGQRATVPPRPSQPVDLTGAGDVFAAGFFIRLQETNDVFESAYFANVVASMAIEHRGPAGAPERAEIEAYIAAHPVVRRWA